MIPLFVPLIRLGEAFVHTLSDTGVSLDTPDPWWAFTMWKMGISFLMLLAPTFFVGASFPLAAKIYAESSGRE